MKNQLKMLITRFNESTVTGNLKGEGSIGKEKKGNVKKGNKTKHQLPN
jgi:hypothetical protein